MSTTYTEAHYGSQSAENRDQRPTRPDQSQLLLHPLSDNAETGEIDPEALFFLTDPLMKKFDNIPEDGISLSHSRYGPNKKGHDFNLDLSRGRRYIGLRIVPDETTEGAQDVLFILLQKPMFKRDVWTMSLKTVDTLNKKNNLINYALKEDENSRRWTLTGGGEADPDEPIDPDAPLHALHRLSEAITFLAPH